MEAIAPFHLRIVIYKTALGISSLLTPIGEFSNEKIRGVTNLKKECSRSLVVLEVQEVV